MKKKNSFIYLKYLPGKSDDGKSGVPPLSLMP